MDLGSKRIGIAVSDPSGTLASPVGVVARTSDPSAHRTELARVAAEWGAGTIVIGLPISLDGREGRAAGDARREAEALGAVAGVPVELFDERLTTVTASRLLSDAGADACAARTRVDAAAAAVMLQSWLDAHRGIPSEEPEGRTR